MFELVSWKASFVVAPEIHVTMGSLVMADTRCAFGVKKIQLQFVR